MDAPGNSFSSELVSLLKSWIPWRSDPTCVSRDFWMPDRSCRVCYECDSQFTLFNRRHHCRLCGRVFCARCTSNSVPAPSADQRISPEEQDRIRVCNYCFKQWQRSIVILDNGIQVSNQDLCSSPSTTSLFSTKSSDTPNSSTTNLGSTRQSAGSYHRIQHSPDVSSRQSPVIETSTNRQQIVAQGRSNNLVQDIGDPSLNQYAGSMNRSDSEDDDFAVYRSDSETRFLEADDYYSQVEFDGISNGYESQKEDPNGEEIDAEGLRNNPLNNDFRAGGLEEIPQLEKKEDDHDTGDECEASSSLYVGEGVNTEPVDFENNGLLWLPPEPEDEEDDQEATLFDEDDDADAAGEWGYFRSSSSFGSGEYRRKDRPGEENKKAMKNVVDGHFRALVAQLLQVENLLVGEEDDQEGWLEIITSLSWEAAMLLKPDMSKGGGMDPGGYVKVKCIASGHRRESMVVKGVVCKKNVAHRRMLSKIEKPRFMILGGALEYQRVSNLLSSFDTLLQQEMDHLKMAVAKIDAHHPDVLLVEKSVSRFAQEYLLAKDISLVLNIKKPLLERISRCTGAQIVPSVDHLSSQRLGYCEKFHVERCSEEHGTAGQNGKKLVKTLMYFEGCPKPLGCTILLRGANGDELKKVKHAIHYGIFAAYHLALETSFLADEGASLPELPLISPITVALRDKLSVERSISLVPGFSITANAKPQEPLPSGEPQRSNSVPASCLASSISNFSSHLIDSIALPLVPNGHGPQLTHPALNIVSPAFSTTPSERLFSNFCHNELSLNHISSQNEGISQDFLGTETSVARNSQCVLEDHHVDGFGPSEVMLQDSLVSEFQNDDSAMISKLPCSSEPSSLHPNVKIHHEATGALPEEFPPSPSDHQSILVSLSSRCVWKGTVCERSHLFRIKYYGSFDKPLGRFLRDHLFDQSYQCRSCEMPSEAHVHCYTHRQGTLTISVKKLPEFLLLGEKEGKIWMWHRCLRCPRANGFPPATRRIVMSDAAWGLSFGKFLELSFSNHAAASRVASCGHSLHRDCLRFYGFGNMVACFRYASIDVHSVYLPPHKLDFNCQNQEWMRKETDEVVDRAELLFSEVLNALRQIIEKGSGPITLPNGMTSPDSRRQISELEGMLQIEKAEFEESLQRITSKDAKRGQGVIDILEMNRLRRQLLFQSYMWDHRLIYAASIDKNNTFHDGLSISVSENREQSLVANEKPTEMNVLANLGKGFNSCDSALVDAKTSATFMVDQEGVGSKPYHSDALYLEIDKHQDLNCGKENNYNVLDDINTIEKSGPLESVTNVRRTLSEGQFPISVNLSDTLDAAWTGENKPGFGLQKHNISVFSDSAVAYSSTANVAADLALEDHAEDKNRPAVPILSPVLISKGSDNVEDSVSWLGMTFLNFYRSLNKNFLASAQKLDTLGVYNPVYISSFRELELQGGARLLLPVGANNTVIPVYDDEPTSIISYALMSPEYHVQISDEGCGETMASFADSVHFQSFNFGDEMTTDSLRSYGSADDSSFLSKSGSRSSVVLDPVKSTKHARVYFADDSQLGKVKYSVTCYFAKRFETLRKICCPSELDYVRSLSRCKKWGAQGGKSNVFFAKTLDERFIIKQVTKTELESFFKFALDYFKYLSESISTGSPTCLAKILGIYQVTSKYIKGGRESKMDVLVMENLLFGRTVTRLYDLKGSSRSRYNPDSSGSNKVLLDQNLIEAMPTSPIFLGNKAKRLLERAVWNDTSFLASIDVMDYSLLVGVDEEKHELVLGIIDFVRQYTWDKHLETWVKTSGILGGTKNSSPTVISPMQYKKRFRKAMTTYFLMVPDQWSPPTIIPSKSQSDLCEENIKDVATGT